MNDALAEYAVGDDGENFPAKDIDSLIIVLDACINEADKFMSSIDVDLDQIISEKETFSKSQLILAAYDKIVDTDDKKNKFRVLTNTMLHLYEASKPEIFERIKFSERFKAIIDRYNAGGSENEDYYEQLLELMEQLKNEATRAAVEGLSEFVDMAVQGYGWIAA